ncbi:MAG: DUF2752 domain-containing protein [Chthoniobacteraceae bacterium]
MFAKPPSLPRDRALIETPLAVGAGVALAVFTATRISSGALPAFTCALMRWTGIPCPACGGTRCLAACGRLDFSSAFAWNPLIALAAFALPAWSALALVDPRFAEKVCALLTVRRLAAAAALNWLYLCWVLPR